MVQNLVQSLTFVVLILSSFLENSGLDLRLMAYMLLATLDMNI